MCLSITYRPRPWKLPILGSIHHLLGEHPHRRLLTLARTHGPLLHLTLARTHTRPELLARKLIFYNDSDFGFAPYGKLWIQLRKICTMELLSVKLVKSFGFIRKDESNRLVESIREAAGSLGRVHRDIDAILNEIIEEHEAKGLKGDGEGEDMVDVLLELQKHWGLDLPLNHNNVKA
ncbi:hypothetical protein HPP92_013576 [Vanilla planifolia]|uniref:Uncharacterized protein n=1 Tax=Vanilla planifolia TaxID=51239 RepID=A0A835QNP8_VANPL|nr:hypothetical protein HPP92_013576 [Vanilla planifolia]